MILKKFFQYFLWYVQADIFLEYEFNEKNGKESFTLYRDVKNYDELSPNNNENISKRLLFLEINKAEEETKIIIWLTIKRKE